MNILILCHGNKYRSPLCAAILKKVNPKLEVRSRGFRKDFARAAKPIREYAQSIGCNLEEHRSLEVEKDDLLWANLIIFMDPSNLKRLLHKIVEINGNSVEQVTADYHCLGE